MPITVLALNYWLHLIATVTWLGGLAMLAFVIWPGMVAGAAQTLEGQAAIKAFIEQIEKRFRPLANISLGVLIVTGLIQMSEDRHYTGLLKIDSLWAAGLLAKHIVIAAMVLVSGIAQWGILPELERAKLLARRGDSRSVAQETILSQRLRRLTAANLALGILVLLATAMITAL